MHIVKKKKFEFKKYAIPDLIYVTPNTPEVFGVI